MRGDRHAPPGSACFPSQKDISAVGCGLLAAEAEAERLVRLCLLGGQAARRQTERWP